MLKKVLKIDIDINVDYCLQVWSFELILDVR